MEAENSKAVCAREHHKWTVLFLDAERKVQQLEEKYKKSIIKARPYFDLKDQYDKKIPIQKQRVECLRKSLKAAKSSYSASLQALEEISNQIHQKRRDYGKYLLKIYVSNILLISSFILDLLVNGPREPGLGAELETPEENLNYQDDLQKLTLTRVNSVASSEADFDDRAQDLEVCTKLTDNIFF